MRIRVLSAMGFFAVLGVLYLGVILIAGYKADHPPSESEITVERSSDIDDNKTSSLNPVPSPAVASDIPVSVSSEKETMVSAAAENSRLMKELEWTFGGKSQRGWYLYIPLISRLIDTETAADSREFAEALARWQRSAGLAPTGVLDSPTLSRMIQTWQSRRIKDRVIPSPEQAPVAPASDFWDPSRPDELRRVEQQTYAAYKRLVAAAAADPSLRLAVARGGELAPTEKYLKIVSAMRTPEYQQRLRAQSPGAGRAGLAINSPHFTGRALDLYVGGDPVSTEDSNRAIQVQTHVYKWLVKNADRFGFRPYFYEPWHWEYQP